jgi:SAM-dependent methyltransferase
MSQILTPRDGFNYYVGQIYWNNFEVVQSKFNYLITGNSKESWQDFVLKSHGKFESAFFLNCGNGWVERDLYQKGLINSVTAFDFSETLVEEAKSHAALMGMPSHYFVADCNNLKMPERSFDVVINYAAMHHVAYINRLTNQIAKLLGRGGQYVSFDYVGPHRNQYPYDLWSQIILMNKQLPERYQKALIYPHIKTMLYSDPTEAIHSELQLEVFNRYFNIEKFISLGGCIAYELLFNNVNLFEDRHTPLGIKTIELILEADSKFSELYPKLNLFAFWIGTPKASTFPGPDKINLWQQEENAREELALSSGGRYYEPLALEVIYDDFDIRMRKALEH